MSAPTQSAFHGVDIPDADVIANCMHCGLCLPHCPTYALTGLEKSSPRGRIRLIKAVAEGEMAMTEGFVDEMNFCLDCQACETACPAGVQYGSLVESARAQIFESEHESTLSRVVKKVVLRWVFIDHRRLKALARVLRLYQNSGLQRFVQKTGLLKFIWPRLHDIQPLAPRVSKQFSSDQLAETMKPEGKPRFRVGLLTGCLMDVAFADVNVDTAKLLLQQGCEVVVPKTQGCCGSLQAHNGDRSTAREMARTLIGVFDAEKVDFIVMNSAGCGAFMKEYGHLFDDDDPLADRAKAVCAKVKDITEFLTETGIRPLEVPARPNSPFEGKRVTYHDACHLVHSQKISRQPRELLRSIPGIEFIELPESTWCCGSAGIYNIVRYDDSMKLLQRKIEKIKSIRPDIIVTGNPGCLIQIQHGLAMEGLEVELLHTASFLRMAYEG